jgi:hypothetical protein
MFDLICVMLVFLTFKTVENKSLAGFITSFFFILTQILILQFEKRRNKINFSIYKLSKLSLTQWGCILFLLLGVFPILSVRTIYPNVEFSTLSFFNIPLESIHKVANNIFLIKLILTFSDSFRFSRNQIATSQDLSRNA